MSLKKKIETKVKVQIHEMPQRSEKWFIERTGKLGGSETKDIVDIKKKLQLKAKSSVMTAVYRVVSEILTKSREQSFTTDAMQWGIDNEEAAVAPFVDEFSTFPGGVTRSDLPHIWLSPDMLSLDEDGFSIYEGYEIKCPTSKTFVKYMDTDKVPSEHLVQCLMYFIMFPSMKSVTLHIYDPRILGKGRKSFRLVREEYQEHLENLEESLFEFCKIVDKTLKLFKIGE